jgi:hypothetical protein
MAWVHEYGDLGFETDSSYLANPNDVFRLFSALEDRDRFELGIDATTTFKTRRGREVNAFAAYDYLVSSHTDMHNVSLGVKIGY